MEEKPMELNNQLAPSKDSSPVYGTVDGESGKPDAEEERSGCGDYNLCWCKGCPAWAARITPFCIGNFIVDNFLAIGLIFFCVLGLVWPSPGVLISHPVTDYVAVVGIFLITGVFLKSNDVKDAITSYIAIIWGVGSILFVTSIIGISVVGVLPYDQVSYKVVNGSQIAIVKPRVFGAREFQRSLKVYFSSPCTVSSGIIMVSQLGGNYALAIVLTIACNLLGTFSMPLLIDWAIKLEGNVTLDTGGLLLKLTLTILLPILIGKALQQINNVNKVCTRFKRQLKFLSVFLLLLLPWTKVSVAKKTGRIASLHFLDVFLIITTVAILHIGFLILNRLACLVLRFSVSQTKCIVILASQKTLAVSLSVVNFLPPAAGSKGLLVVPLLIGHFTIIIMDSILVVIWAKISPPSEELDLLQDKPAINCFKWRKTGQEEAQPLEKMSSDP